MPTINKVFFNKVESMRDKMISHILQWGCAVVFLQWGSEVVWVQMYLCRLNFTVAETFGEEEESILQTAKLWQNNISAIIGPIETCVHEVKLDISRRLIGQLKPAIDWPRPRWLQASTSRCSPTTASTSRPRTSPCTRPSCAPGRASKEGSQKFLNHREGPW